MISCTRDALDRYQAAQRHSRYEEDEQLGSHFERKERERERVSVELDINFEVLFIGKIVCFCFYIFVGPLNYCAFVIGVFNYFLAEKIKLVGVLAEKSGPTC